MWEAYSGTGQGFVRVEGVSSMTVPTDKLKQLDLWKDRYEKFVFNRVETVCSQSVYACMLMTTAVIELVLDHVLADMNNIILT